MPRTGSTLLGTLFLLVRDPPGSGPHVFERYVHEPIAPVFWERRSIADVVRGVGGRLTPRDVIQESAYQFTDKDVARWFLHRARRPIAFTIRDPRISWPSRWRILLRMRIAQGAGPDEDRIRSALESDDFSDVGDVLLRDIEVPDNGWLAYLSLLQECRSEGIPFVLVENGRLRQDPRGVLADLCGRWGVPFDSAMVDWDDLGEAIPRVLMSDLAAGEEYEWYYERTLSSRGGIAPHDRAPLALERFPVELRGPSDDVLTIDTAVAIYERLLVEEDVAGS